MIIVPWPLTISATSLNILMIFIVLFEFSMKHIRTLFFVRKTFFKSFTSVKLSIIEPRVLNLARLLAIHINI